MSLVTISTLNKAAEIKNQIPNTSRFIDPPKSNRLIRKYFNVNIWKNLESKGDIATVLNLEFRSRKKYSVKLKCLS